MEFALSDRLLAAVILFVVSVVGMLLACYFGNKAEAAEKMDKPMIGFVLFAVFSGISALICFMFSMKSLYMFLDLG